MIAPQPFVEPRGTPISVYQRLEGLSRLGHSVDLLTYHVGEDVSLPGVEIHRIPRVPFIKELKVGPSLAKVPLDVLLFFKAIGMLLRKKYDVIHSHEEAAFFSVFLAALFRKRHLYDMHSSLPRQLQNFDFGNVWPIIQAFRWFERVAIGSCDALITIGPDLEKYAYEIRPDVAQMMIENLPLRTTSMSRKSVEALREKTGIKNRLAIVYTGTFERYQGVDLLLESAKIIAAQYPEVVFVLVGGKPEQIEAAKEQVASNVLEKSMIFTGTLPIEEANQYMELADILVSPRIEGTSVPLKIYTYLHTGKPIVATNLSAHTLVLTKDTAILVEPVKEAFAAGIMALLKDRELRERIGVQAKKLAEEKYNASIYLSRLEKIYSVLSVPAVTREGPSADGQAAEGPAQTINN
jgi:glycosyltransferase involved in cell wall biosynthesis